MKLAKREKYLVILTGAVIFLIIVFEFLISPFLEAKVKLKNGVKEKEAALEEMFLMRAEYNALKNTSQDLQDIIARRRESVTLFSFLEKQAGQADIKGNISYMKPSVSQGTGPYKESMVEMKLIGITLKQLADFLYCIESPQDVISVKRISIKENTKESGYLDVILQVLTLE